MKIHLLCVIFLSAQYAFSQTLKSQTKSSNDYVCLPCGSHCDNMTYHAPGKCSHCNMPLVKKVSVVFKTITPSEICNYIKTHPNVILLDVRTKDEFENKGFHKYGTLKNAINIPIQDFPTRLSELSAYKNKEIIVYCSHSQRSPQVSHMLTENGFTKVSNMAGGMSEMEDDTCKK